MNQLCKVCGEPAAGFHFGAFTCEGCKSFFGRTYNNISAIAGCKNNGDCVINKKNRTACKACRLRKCLLVGMSKSGSRYGRRSNWFKIHCLLQEQQSQQGSGMGGNGTAGGGGNNNNNNSSSNNNLEQLARLHQMQARQTYQDKTNPCIKSASLSPSADTVASTTSAGLGIGLPAALSQNLAGSVAAGNFGSSSPPTHQGHYQNTQNFLSAAKFLNGLSTHQHQSHQQQSHQQQQHQQHLLHHHHQQQLNHNNRNAKNVDSRRLTDTPSDSGASSAGAEANDELARPLTTESDERPSLNRSRIRPSDGEIQPPRGPDSDGGGEESGGPGGLLSAIDSEDRRNQFLHIFRSHSEPLRCGPFVSFIGPSTPLPALACHGRQHSSFFPSSLKEEFSRSVSELAARAAAVAAAAAAAAAQCVQEEPIDLSLKATASMGVSPDTSGGMASCCGSNPPQSPTPKATDDRDGGGGIISAMIEVEAPSGPNGEMSSLRRSHQAKSSPLDLTLVRSAQATPTLSS